MQKLNIITLICLGTLFIFSACDKTLDQVSKDTANKEDIFGTEEGLELYSNSFYSIVPSMNAITRGDDMTDYSVTKQVEDYLRPNVYSATSSSGWDWEPLRNLNFFIVNCRMSALSVEVRENYIGLARFFRAWWYFKMVKKFGNVPWYGKPLTIADTTELYKPRDPRTLIMDSVLADINFACTHIRLAEDDSRSLVTKWVAYALKSRICLYEGTFRKYHKEYDLASSADLWLKNAAAAASAVMDSSGFVLHSGNPSKSYRQLFISTSPVADEVMLADVADPNLDVLGDATWWYTSATYGDRLNFNRTFMNTYLNIDGTPFTAQPGYQTETFTEEIQNRDRRLSQTIRTPGYKRTNGESEVAAPPDFGYTYTGYQPIKFSLDDEQYDQDVNSINSIPVIRFAEVLLNYAEAKAELGTLSDNDWAETIGALRARSGITGGLNRKPTVVDHYFRTHYFPSVSDPVILEVRRERSIELVLEGFRFDDLVRWKRGDLLEQDWYGMYVPAINKPMDLDNNGTADVEFVQGAPSNTQPGVKYVDVSSMTSGGRENPIQLEHGTYGRITWLKDADRIWKDYKYLYPIPKSALIKNPKLGQNKGW